MTDSIERKTSSDKREARRIATILTEWRHTPTKIPYSTLGRACGMDVRTIQRWMLGENPGDRISLSAIRAMEALRPGLVEKLFPRAERSQERGKRKAA